VAEVGLRGRPRPAAFARFITLMRDKLAAMEVS
jgi:hypothetical protein